MISSADVHFMLLSQHVESPSIAMACWIGEKELRRGDAKPVTHLRNLVIAAETSDAQITAKKKSYQIETATSVFLLLFLSKKARLHISPS